MRNYVALNLMRAWYADNQGNQFSKLIWGVDGGDAQTNLDWMTNQLSSGPVQSLDDLNVNYVMLDKINIAQLLTVMGSGFPFNTIGSHNYFFQKDPPTDAQGPVPSDNTPRNGWTDNNNVKRLPTPSDGVAKAKSGNNFGGASTLYSFYTALPRVASAIVKLRNPVGGKLYAKRIAGLVMDIYTRITLKSLTISDGVSRYHTIVVDNIALFNQLA